MDRKPRNAHSGRRPVIWSRRQLEFLLAYNPRPRRARHRPTRLDWWVNALAILIVLLLAAFLAHEFHGKSTAEVEWLPIAARMLAYDKPL